MTYELTQLHHITSEELKLLQNYRLLSHQEQKYIGKIAELQADGLTHEGGNVIPFRRPHHPMPEPL